MKKKKKKTEKQMEKILDTEKNHVKRARKELQEIGKLGVSLLVIYAPFGDKSKRLIR